MKQLKILLLVAAVIFLAAYRNIEYASSMDQKLIKENSDLTSNVSMEIDNKADPRSYQHGMTILPRQNGTYWAIWSSSGNPPKGEMPDGNWSHDVYYSIIDPKNPVIKPVTIISEPEAQEPSSAAETTDGHIIITIEDGWNVKNEVGQRFGIYDRNMKPVLPYPQMVLDGGHSGHAAASGNRFVVFYSSDWVDGGGYNNLGSGKDVLAAVYNSIGRRLFNRNIAVNDERNCWPLVAGSETGACLLWQHFKAGQSSADLMFAILDPANGKYIKAPVKIHSNVKFYHYSVAYVSSIKRFIVLGTGQSGKGFGYLIDNRGKMTVVNQNLPPVMRESNLVVGISKGKPIVGMVKTPTGAAVLSVTASEIKVKQLIKDNFQWQYCGTDGIFTDANQLYILSLATNGMVEKRYDLKVK
ncbi:MAG TPA: hypothetical protein VHT34_03940 [Clostridia bacterium]|nr:hypothetical protein [Clostridia bacterium]